MFRGHSSAQRNHVPREIKRQFFGLFCLLGSGGNQIDMQVCIAYMAEDEVSARQYFVAPPNKAPENGYNASNFAMSKPAFDPQDREVWYSDGGRGFACPGRGRAA